MRSLIFDFAQKQRKTISYIPGLDGLRAISILLVLFAHFGFEKVVPGGLGVTIFFFISGFLISTLLLVEYDRSGRIDFQKFYARRFLRLAPELLVFLSITLTIATATACFVAPGKIAAAMLYMMNYYRIWGGPEVVECTTWGHLWSLAVEEHFYLTYPLALMLFYRKPRHILIMSLSVIAASNLWRFAVLALGFPDQYAYFATETRMDSIAYGCVLAYALRYHTAISQWIGKTNWILPVVSGLLMLISLFWKDPVFRETLRYTVQGVSLCLFFAFVYGAHGGRWALAILNHPFLSWIGLRSYSAYLWHFEASRLAQKLTGVQFEGGTSNFERHALAIGLALVLTAAMAEASYRLIHLNLKGLHNRFATV